MNEQVFYKIMQDAHVKYYHCCCCYCFLCIYLFLSSNPFFSIITPDFPSDNNCSLFSVPVIWMRLPYSQGFGKDPGVAVCQILFLWTQQLASGWTPSQVSLTECSPRVGQSGAGTSCVITSCRDLVGWWLRCCQLCGLWDQIGILIRILLVSRCVNSSKLLSFSVPQLCHL